MNKPRTHCTRSSLQVMLETMFSVDKLGYEVNIWWEDCSRHGIYLYIIAMAKIRIYLQTCLVRVFRSHVKLTTVYWNCSRCYGYLMGSQVRNPTRSDKCWVNKITRFSHLMTLSGDFQALHSNRLYSSHPNSYSVCWRVGCGKGGGGLAKLQVESGKGCHVGTEWGFNTSTFTSSDKHIWFIFKFDH